MENKWSQRKQFKTEKLFRKGLRWGVKGTVKGTNTKVTNRRKLNPFLMTKEIKRKRRREKINTT